MDRVIVYPGAIPLETDILSAQRNAMIAAGYIARAALGTSVWCDGLQCTPTSPASMSVNVAPGAIGILATIDTTAYSTLAADNSDPLVKVGINIATTTFALTAPTTSGQSQIYLIQAAFSELDGSP